MNPQTAVLDLQFPLLFIRGKFSTIFKADQKGTALIDVCVCVHLHVCVCEVGVLQLACLEYSRASLYNVNAQPGHP